MRLYYLNQLKDGMILSTSVFDRTLRLLLKSGSVLDSRLISLLKSKGISYVFIRDENIGDLDIEPLVSDKIKYKTLNCLEAFIANVVKPIPSFKNTAYERLKHVNDSDLIKQLSHKELRENVKEVLYDIDSKKAEERYFSYYKYIRSFTEIAFEIMTVSVLIGKRLDYGSEEIIQLGVSALLHDIGWILYPNFNWKSFSIEYFDMSDEAHTTYGYKFLRESKHLTALEYLPALEHHEFGDGSGFPNKKTSDFSFPDRNRNEKDDQIFRLSEIVGLVSTLFYTAEKTDIVTSLNHIKQSKNSEYNPYIVDALDFVFNPYPIGSTVELHGHSDEFIARGVVINNTVPKFIPSIKTDHSELIPVEKTSRYRINVI